MKEVTAAIIRENGKILICQRAEDDECGLLWEFPGGKREGDETLEECIKREIMEELELDIELTGIFSESIYEYNGNRIFFTVFNAKIAKGKPCLNVHNSVLWVTLNELDNYKFMPADIGFVAKLLKERNM